MNKQEEILEGNKLMAEFMGFTVFHKRYPRNHGIGAPEAEWKDMIVEKAKYHTSWDWLMPVVEKIEKIHHITDEGDWGTYSFNLHDTYTSFGYGRFRIGTAISGENRIHSTWLAVVYFIQWYNNQTITK